MTFDQSFRIYEIFNFYFKNEADAKALTSEIESLVNGQISTEKIEFATKNDIAEVKDEIKRVELATKNDIAEVKDEIKRVELATKGDIAEVKGEIKRVELATKSDIAEVKGEIKNEIKQLEIKMEQGFKDVLKWMIALMIGFASLILTFAKMLS